MLVKALLTSRGMFWRFASLLVASHAGDRRHADLYFFVLLLPVVYFLIGAKCMAYVNFRWHTTRNA